MAAKFTPKHRAEDFTFGVEIETTVPDAAVSERRFSIGGYHNGRKQSCWRDTILKDVLLMHDSSINAEHDRKGIEFVTPILKGQRGIETVCALCDDLAAIGAQSNQSCGLHVHVGLPEGITSVQAKSLAHQCIQFSDFIFLAGRDVRRTTNNYCKSLLANRIASRTTPITANDLAEIERYFSVNFNHYPNRLEFRAYGGSIDKLRVLTAVWCSIAVVQRALSLDAPGARKSIINKTWSEIANRGLRRLGWTDDRWGLPLGYISSPGTTPLAASVKMIRQYAASVDVPLPAGA